MQPLTRNVRNEAMTMLSELSRIKHRLGQMGFFKAMRAMDAAVSEFGFELAERAALTDHGPEVAGELAKVHARYRKERTA